ncbi:MAG: thioredoxin family protein [Candidatus Riflebacteria bacterium]|nr:thioredoxin family protein [Candidatus Riflebacteria bacterium]
MTRSILTLLILSILVITAGGGPLPAVDLPHLRPGAADPIGLIGSPGQRLDLEGYVVPGKLTVFDFFSHRCPPCRLMAPKLERLVAARADVVVRTIDIDRAGARGIDFGSPVARQHKLEALPHFEIFDAQGRLWLRGTEAYERLLEWSSAVAPEPTSPPRFGGQRRAPGSGSEVGW